ncbi:MAG: 50S ribosomal protein L33 [Thermotogota bacterium]|jgi:large subunit ribosomal protein L33
MAAKSQVINFSLKCEECGTKNYYKKKNKTIREKIELKKYCPKCGKHTLHKEAKL